MAKSKFLENYDRALPLIRRIFANDLRVRILQCLSENARFFDEIVAFVEGDKLDVYKELVEMEKMDLIECRDEIYSLKMPLGTQTAKFMKDMDELRPP